MCRAEVEVLHDDIKNLQHMNKLSVSQKIISGERRFFRLYKGKKEMFFKEPLTEWFFYGIACDEPFKHLYF